MPTVDSPPMTVSAAFDGLPHLVRQQLLKIRQQIYQQAAAIDGVGPLSETLKWGEPAYLTEAPKTGTTLRLGQIGGQAALMVPCSTSIIEDARRIFGELPEFSGARGVLLKAEPQVVAHIIHAALTYHMR